MPATISRLLLMLLTGVLLASKPGPVVEERDFQPLFAKYAVRGSLLFYDASANRYTAYNLMRCRQGFLPASTFKIPNMLIGLATGALTDTAEVCHWDGVTRAFPEWNRDMSFAAALRASCVPCYQQLARRIAPATYATWLKKLHYPGMGITEATRDTFWLDGASRITQFEQIAFLRRLQAGSLPIATRHQQAVKQVMRLSRTPHYQLYGKTGWRFRSPRNPDNGWFVGWLERTDGRVIFFALNEEPVAVQATPPQFAASRRAIVESALAALGWLGS
jgi:beta-lactamase class D